MVSIQTSSLAVRSHRLLKERSDAFEDYVESCLMLLDTTYKIGDENINTRLQKMGLTLVVDNSRKTPDICIKSGDVLYVGDCAVSQSVGNVEKFKKEKYDSLRNEIMTLNEGIRVEHLDLVVNDKGSNLDSINERLEILIGRKIPNGYTEDIRSKFIDNFNIRRDLRRAAPDVNEFDKELSRLLNRTGGFFDDYAGGEIVEKFESNKTDKDVYNEIDKRIKDVEDNEKTEDSIINLKQEVYAGIKEFNKENLDKKVRSPLDIIMNMDNMETVGDLDLVEDYMNDLIFCTGSKIIDLLPCKTQLQKMKNIKEDIIDVRRLYNNKGVNNNGVRLASVLKEKYGQTTEYYCSKVQLVRKDGMTKAFHEEVIEEMNKRNDNKSMKSIPVEKTKECVDMIQSIGKYMSEESENKHMISTNEDFDTPIERKKKEREQSSIRDIKREYELINRSKGVNYASAIQQHCNDIFYIKNYMKEGFYYSIPRQRSGIIMTYTKASINKDSTFWRVSVTRVDKNNTELIKKMKKMYKGSIYHVEESQNYVYFSSKITSIRLSVANRLKNIDYEFRTYLMCMYEMFGTERKNWEEYKKSMLGVATCLILDIRQLPSEILDNMKYIVGMIFADRSQVRKLLTEKLARCIKTSLDMYLIEKMLNYYILNVNMNQHVKEEYSERAFDIGVNKQIIINKLRMRSFYNNDIIISDMKLFLTEAQAMFQFRPKKLYMSQAINKSAMSVINFNKEAKKEREELGIKDVNDFFGNKFDFTKSHIIDGDTLVNAISYYESELIEKSEKIKGKIYSQLETINVYNSSMRGSCKRLEDIAEETGKTVEEIKESADSSGNIKIDMKKIGFSEPAVLSNLKANEENIRKNKTEESKIINFVKENMDKQMTYNMSEKEQRGGARPIGSPCAYTKQKLYVADSPFGAIGDMQDNNLLARRVNRAAKITNYSQTMTAYCRNNNLKYKAYFVQDQTKFSESDVIEKFLITVANCQLLPEGVKHYMYKCFDQMMSRIQKFPKIPKIITEEDREEYVQDNIFIKGTTGWVQGMLNKSSTYIHIVAVEYLTHIFEKFEKEKDPSLEFKSICLVNSDDSMQIVCSNKKDIIDKFYRFIQEGKKMFALKLNLKKSYLSYMMGEVIQKYEINENAINIYEKEVVSVFNQIIGFDLVKDTLSSIGSLGTLNKSGVTESLLVVIRKELRDKINRTFNRGQNSFINTSDVDIGKLPIEIGGWPRYLTTYELMTCGTFSQMNYCKNMIEKENEENRISKESKIILSAMIHTIAKPGDIEINGTDAMNRNKIDNELLYGIIKNASEKFTEMIPDQLDNDGIKEVLYMDKKVEDIEEQKEYYAEDMDYNLEDFSQSIKENKNINEAGIIRGLISPISFKIPLTRKQHKTIDKFKDYKYEPSGFGPLFRNRTSIQTAIADKKEMLVNDSVALSEENASRDGVTQRKINTMIKFGNYARINGTKVRGTIKTMWRYLEFSYDILKVYKTIQKFMRSITNILEDPTERSAIAESVIRNVILLGDKPKGNTVVNVVPYTQDNIRTENDIVSVLISMIDPNYLETQGYRFRDKGMLSVDMALIRNLHNYWLRDKNLTVNNLVKIYYHYLKSKTNKYHLSSHLRTSNVKRYMIDVYLKNKNNKVDIIADSRGVEGLVRDENMIQKNANTICAAYEILRFFLRRRKEGARQLAEWITVRIQTYGEIEERDGIGEYGITVKLYNLLDLIDSEDFRMIYNGCSYSSKKVLAILALMIDTKSKYINDFRETERINQYYIIRQKVEKDVKGNMYYTGKFKVQLSLGKNVIVITGEPGDIEDIESNTDDVEVIKKLLFHFVANNNFRGFNRPRRSGNIFANNFYRTKNLYSEYIIVEEDGEIVIFKNRMEKNKIEIGKRMLSQQLAEQISNRSINYKRELPLRMNRRLTDNRKDLRTLKNLRIDVKKNMIVGDALVLIDNVMQNSTFEAIRMPYMCKFSDSNLVSTVILDFQKIDFNEYIKSEIALNIVRGHLGEIPESKLYELFLKTHSLKEMLGRNMIDMIAGIVGYTEHVVRDELNVVEVNVGMSTIEELLKKFDSKDSEVDVMDYSDDDDYVERYNKKQKLDYLNEEMKRAFLSSYVRKNTEYSRSDIDADIASILITESGFLKILKLCSSSMMDNRGEIPNRIWTRIKDIINNWALTLNEKYLQRSISNIGLDEDFNLIKELTYSTFFALSERFEYNNMYINMMNIMKDPDDLRRLIKSKSRKYIISELSEKKLDYDVLKYTKLAAENLDMSAIKKLYDMEDIKYTSTESSSVDSELETRRIKKRKANIKMIRRRREIKDIENTSTSSSDEPRIKKMTNKEADMITDSTSTDEKLKGKKSSSDDEDDVDELRRQIEILSMKLNKISDKKKKDLKTDKKHGSSSGTASVDKEEVLEQDQKEDVNNKNTKDKLTEFFDDFSSGEYEI